MDAMERATLCLDGLSVGNAFGKKFYDSKSIRQWIRRRTVPTGHWRYGAETEMALSVVEELAEAGSIGQDSLARRLATRLDRTRGYQDNVLGILQLMREGGVWRTLTQEQYGGDGSRSCAAAMRSAPIGAYFAEDLDQVVWQARQSAEVTNFNPDGIAGGIAVAVATALAWQGRSREELGNPWLEQILERVPEGPTHRKIRVSLELPADAAAKEVNRKLGDTTFRWSSDTVPLCLWLIARFSQDYADTLWRTVAFLGERETTCAIVGGILALRVGPEGLPGEWLQAREKLPC